MLGADVGAKENCDCSATVVVAKEDAELCLTGLGHAAMEVVTGVRREVAIVTIREQRHL